MELPVGNVVSIAAGRQNGMETHKVMFQKGFPECIGSRKGSICRI